MNEWIQLALFHLHSPLLKIRVLAVYCLGFWGFVGERREIEELGFLINPMMKGSAGFLCNSDGLLQLVAWI